MRLVFDESGDPTKVLRLEDYTPPPPQGHEVQVKMLYAPINPADLNFIEGTYGRKPEFPATPGIEGVGRVEKIGDAVQSLKVGDMVVPLAAKGSWSSRLNLAENQLAIMPEGLDELQAAMFRVNPATAWRMLHEYRLLVSGDWLVQNAANSGVGRSVIQIAKSLGLKTLNFVRRPEVIEELKKLGADGVFLDNEEGLKQALEMVGDSKVRLALNAVGGDSALRLMEVLSVSGTMVTYGAMSRRSLKVPNKYLIFKDLELRGCWLSRWMDHASTKEIADVMRPLVALALKGELVQPVDKIFELKEHQEAIKLAQQSKRAGKVLFRM